MIGDATFTLILSHCFSFRALQTKTKYHLMLKFAGSIAFQPLSVIVKSCPAGYEMGTRTSVYQDFSIARLPTIPIHL